MYDEYEEECLQNIDELVVETTPSDEKSRSAMPSQKVKVRKDDESTGGDSLPLCDAYFELIRNMIKTSKQKKKETEVVQAKNLCKNGSGCSRFQIKTFSDILLPRTSPHQEEV